MRRKRSFWDLANVASFWERVAEEEVGSPPAPIPPSYSARASAPPTPSARSKDISALPPPMDCTLSASSAIASLDATVSTSLRRTSALCSKLCNTSQKYGLGMASILSTCAARTSMICCNATASMLFIPEVFSDEAGAPLPVPAAAGAPPADGAVAAGALLLAASPTIFLKLDNATPRRAATFSTGHAPCIFAWTADSPARDLRLRASARLVSADCISV
mmetsp:Transcript_33321/g.70037  ORF Transcript_33321/g.70037 Transcript_33321/m.70037 type:complete len:219 (-) Transcript_33321:905-1561(-)